MRYIVPFLLILLLCQPLAGQDISFSEALYQTYDTYKETAIKKKRFKQDDLKKIIEGLKTDDRFHISRAGKSVQGRDIYLVKIGTGKTSVLLWSQMHGDESTATMALMDIFNFFQEEGNFEDEKQQMLENLSIYFIPMLNPDGAQRFTRRNALGIDINRDALRLASPESRILKSVRDSLDADFGFNLHDQDMLWSAGVSGPPATISLLAPSFNYEKDVNEVRKRAIKLVVLLERTLSRYIPGQVAKWTDDFEPRAFGDNVQRWGTSTLLIESGGYKGDPEKQYQRKLNFVAILTALRAMGDESYKDENMEDYFEIPENDRYLFNLLIKNATVSREGKTYQADLGINRSEVDIENYTDYYYRSNVDDLGDLSTYSGYDELDATGLTLVPGKTYPEAFTSLEALKKSDIQNLLLEGYTQVRVRQVPEDKHFTGLPVNISSDNDGKQPYIGLGSPADFVLKEGGKVKYAIVNGFIYDLEKGDNGVVNALVD